MASPDGGTVELVEFDDSCATDTTCFGGPRLA